MKLDPFRIAEGGEQRLRKAIESQVRCEHETELSAATDDSQRGAVEEKIEREIQEEMRRVASPYSLWSSQ